MYTLELAQPAELAVCYAMIEAGRAFQQAQGFVQWTADYPNLDTIRSDIRDQKGYVVRADGEIAGYLCIDFDGEPAYAKIDGAWHTAEPYAVVHRMAFDSRFRGQGLAGTTFRLVETLCREKAVPSIRVDTDFPNKRMQHILEKAGFSQCGVIVFQGSGKLAYEKSL